MVGAPTHLLTRSATLRRQEQTGSDVYGDAIYDYVEEAVLCELQQDRVREIRDGRELEVSVWSLFLPAGISTSGWDEIAIDGRVYTFDGDPWEVRHPTSGEWLFSEIKCRQVR